MSIDVKDRYGEYGITGLAIAELNDGVAKLDTLLMSCRILGRRIEEVFFDEIVSSLQEHGIEELQATYLRTLKNGQVKDYYDRMGMQLKDFDPSEEQRKYELRILEHKVKGPKFIKVEKQYLRQED
jgi:predicted enzyme involved in methoxymalonyl-ACP biosynthesis